MPSQESNFTINTSLAFKSLSHVEPRFKVMCVQMCVNILYIFIYECVWMQVTEVETWLLRDQRAIEYTNWKQQEERVFGGRKGDS